MRVYRAAGSCVFPWQARRAWFPCRSRTNNRRRRGLSLTISCPRRASADGGQPDHAGLERVGAARRAPNVGGPDVTGKAILHGVGDLDGIILVTKWNNGQEWPEHFFLRDAHPGMRAR